MCSSDLQVDIAVESELVELEALARAFPDRGHEEDRDAVTRAEDLRGMEERNDNGLLPHDRDNDRPRAGRAPLEPLVGAAAGLPHGAGHLVGQGPALRGALVAVDDGAVVSPSTVTSY